MKPRASLCAALAGLAIFAGLLACHTLPPPRERQTETVSAEVAAMRIGRRGPVNILLSDSLRERPVIFHEPDWEYVWRDDLYDLADQLDAEIWPLGEATFLLFPSNRVSMHFEGADMSIILDLVARNSGASLIAVSPDVVGLAFVDIDVDKEPFHRIFERIARDKHLVILREGDGIYRFSTPEHERELSRRPLPVEALNALGLGRSHPKRWEAITFDLDGTMASEAVKEIGTVLDAEIGFDAALDVPITLHLYQAAWREALEAIAWMTDGVLWDDGLGKISIQNVPRCNMEFFEADVQVVLGLIAKNCSGIKLKMSDDLEGSCGLNARNTPWRDLIYSLSRKVPFHLRVKPDGTFLAEPF